MTNKEAIEHINLILLRDRNNELHFVSHDEEEALNIAIEALEKEEMRKGWLKELADRRHEELKENGYD